MPRGPETSTTPPRPSQASASSAISSASSRSRPASSGEPPSRAAGSSSGPGGASSAGSCARIASCSARSSAPGSTPISSTSVRRAAAVGLERLRLAAAAVQGEHQLAVQVLAERLLRHGGLELGDQIRVPAERELGLDARLECRPAPLLEAGDLGLRERLVGESRRAEVRARGRAPAGASPPRRPDRTPSRPGPEQQAPRSGPHPARPGRRSAGRRFPGSRGARFGQALAAGKTPGSEASCAPSAEATRPTAPPPADRSQPARWPEGPGGPAEHAVARCLSTARDHHRRELQAGPAGESPKFHRTSRNGRAQRGSGRAWMQDQHARGR